MSCEDLLNGLIIVLRDFEDEEIFEAWDALHDTELFEKLRYENELIIMAALDKAIYKAIEYYVEARL